MRWSKWRNPKLATAAGFLILVAIIWFAGPPFGLKSPETRAAWVFGVMFLWVLTLLVGKILAERAGSLLERVLRRQSDDAVLAAHPNARTEVAAIRQRLLTAIDTLKTSKLGKVKGKAALYELPWYMIIGHPAAGKSSAILNSGLTFPFTDKGKSSIQGIGGTRNCDWFFATEGVLIDTAGRYATQREDRPEWLEFLKLLKKYRARAPVNGILVAVSLPELMQFQTESFVTYARQVRERINEIDDAFGIKVPVYLAITKLDLLGGFSQFFEDLSEEERSQVWGATLTHEQGRDFDAARAVGQHFDSLVQGLTQLGMDKLAAHRGNLKRPSLFAFPIEFQGLRDPICKFVQVLFEDDPYHSRPLLRGFYLSSALQEGNPRIAAGVRVSRQFDLPRAGFEMAQQPAANSYFLRDLFRDVIFPDQFMVGRQARPLRNRARLGAIAAGAAALAIVTAAWTWSYMGNQKFVQAAHRDFVAAKRFAATGQLLDGLKGLELLQLRVAQLYRYREEGHPWAMGLGLYQGDKVERDLRAAYFSDVRSLMLAPVKANLEQKLLSLRGLENKSGLANTYGVAGARSASEQIANIKQVSYTRIASVAAVTEAATKNLLAATAGSASPGDSVTASATELEQAYNALKTYLMLHARERMDGPHLANQLPKNWQSWLESRRNGASSEEINRIASRVVAFYLAQIPEPDLPLIDNSTELVGEARSVLRAEMRRIPAKERLYNELKARANARYAPLTVGRILDNQNADIVGGSYAVPGAFTREAWDNYFNKAILEASKGELKGDDWVLAVAMTDLSSKDAMAEHNRADLEALYRADYAQEWKKFLLGVGLHDVNKLTQVAAAMGRLGDTHNSPLKRILQRAAFETAWDNPSELAARLESAKTSVVARAEQLMKSGAQPGLAASATNQYGEVGGQFAALALLAGSPQTGGRAPIDSYMESLLKLKNKFDAMLASGETGTQARQLMQATVSGGNSEFSEALYQVDNVLLGTVSADTRNYVRPMLVRPLMQAYGSLVPVVEDDINRSWEQKVYANWQGLASKYPFANSNNEAQMSDIAKFLRPGDGLVPRFIDQQLGPLVIRRNDGFTARTWADMGIHFSPGFLSGMSRLLATGSAVLQDGDGSHFELQPVPTPGMSEILIEIDGQLLRYRNGPQPWVAFNWPNPGASLGGARLQAVSFAGVPLQVANYSGRLGLMRLLADARTHAGEGGNVMEWRVKPLRADGKDNSKADWQTIRFNYRPVSGANLLALSNLRGLSLPQRITQ